jgi:hypothetical protein
MKGDIVLNAASAVGAAVRRNDGPEIVAEARRRLNTARIEKAIKNAMTSEYPPDHEDVVSLCKMLMEA